MCYWQKGHKGSDFLCIYAAEIHLTSEVHWKREAHITSSVFGLCRSLSPQKK